MKKKIGILGSTGSIGENTLNVVREFDQKFEVVFLTANSNVEKIYRQIIEFEPQFAVLKDSGNSALLKEQLGDDSNCTILTGSDSISQITKNADYDILISSMVGFAGLSPTIEGIKRGKRVALANKETLVVAGETIMNLSKTCNSEIIPVDSEHSAIFQCLVGESKGDIEKLILTASGGPFINKSREELENVSLNEALNHPNWKMGRKITIDSATMMNKGLEVIEAHWLFGLPREKIEVVVHPQSIIHSLVEFVDGSIKAQLSLPDMKLPIQYALSYPERLISKFVETNLPKIHQMTFYEPDFSRFRCLKLAYDVMEQGGTFPCILNAANEIAVDKFLSGDVKFTQIPDLIDRALNEFENVPSPDIDTIFECDRQTREYLNRIYN
jgi:1-deoxy-D-xylulose-5-phosphate reductoisomerase